MLAHEKTQLVGVRASHAGGGRPHLAVARLLSFAVVLAMGAPADLSAAEYFVDFDGTPGATCSDSGPGTDPRAGGTPWCTLPGTRVTANIPGFLPGPWARIHPGDTVSIKAGTTHTSANDGGPVLIDPAHYDDGTASARIVVRKHPTWGTGPYASFDGTGMVTPKGAIVSVFAVDYVTLDGLEVYESPDFGMQVEHDAHHVIIDHAYVHDGHTKVALVYLSGCTTTPCMQVIRNSTVANCAAGGGIYVYDNPGGYVLVQNNVVHHICGGAGNYDGVQCGAQDGKTNYCAFIDNVVYAHAGHSGYPDCAHAGSDPIDAGGVGCHRKVLVDGNEVFDSGGRFLVLSSYEDGCDGPLESYGIARRNRLTNLETVAYSYPNDTIFYNNTVYNPDMDVSVQIFSPEAAAPPGTNFGTDSHGPRAAAVGRDIDFGRLTFKNNVMWGQRRYHVLINGVSGFRDDVRYSSLRFYYDLYSAFHPTYWYANDTDQLAVRYSTAAAFAAARATDSPDVGSIFSNTPTSAVFVDAASRDYRLIAGSPAIDAGTAVTHAVGDSGGGANGSLALTVERASFVDGWGGLFAPDHISVGNCPDVAIAAVNDFDATIVLASPCRWLDGDPVNLAYQGNAPDIGAYEFAVTTLSTPTATPPATPSAAATPAPTATGGPDCSGCGPCETCNAIAGCVAAPRDACHPPVAPVSGQLRLTTKRVAKLAWTWAKGAATTLADFGDPLAGDHYTLCIFDESGATPRLAFSAGTRSGTCRTKPCWHRARPSRFRYTDPEGTPDGLVSLLLKPGVAGKARVLVAGKGAHLALPSLPLSLPARVQLQAANGQCWEARYHDVHPRRNTSTAFNAKGSP